MNMDQHLQQFRYVYTRRWIIRMDSKKEKGRLKTLKLKHKLFYTIFTLKLYNEYSFTPN